MCKSKEKSLPNKFMNEFTLTIRIILICEFSCKMIVHFLLPFCWVILWIYT